MAYRNSLKLALLAPFRSAAVRRLHDCSSPLKAA
jgi:hypothetical protein